MGKVKYSDLIQVAFYATEDQFEDIRESAFRSRKSVSSYLCDLVGEHERKVRQPAQGSETEAA